VYLSYFPSNGNFSCEDAFSRRDTFNRRDTQVVSYLINMTDEPISLYDECTGDIVVFTPDPRRLCKIRNEKDFPEGACYVFASDEDDGFEWFLRHYDDVALICGVDNGRGGAKITKLAPAREPRCRIVYNESYFNVRFPKRACNDR